MAVATVKEQCYTYDNFCVRKTKYIIHNVQDYSVLHITFLARLYMWRLPFYSRMECTCMTVSFHQKGRFGSIE